MRFANSLLVWGVLLAVFAADAQAVVIQWSAVGNPGNANDPADGDSGTAGVQNFGAVPYAYNIGTYDVTASQYVEFLNAKDPTSANTLLLYEATRMSDPIYGGVSFSAGNLPGSKYGVISGRGNHPANFTNWYDAIRFANWVNNGQGSGDTETGAYTLGTILFPGPLTHNAGSQVWLPTENEWYKAAYYDPRTTAQGGPPSDSHYWLYGTSSNSTPIQSLPTALANHANYNNALFNVFNVTDVGAYTGTTSAYGAFDMAGNVTQWNEDLIKGAFRDLRGGSFFDSLLQSSDQSAFLGGVENFNVGFRLASVPGVPEPSTGVLAVIAGAMLWWWRKRFK